MALDEAVRKLLVGGKSGDSAKILNYVNSLRGNFTDTQIEDFTKNPYFKDYATGGYNAVFNKMGITDPTVQSELYGKLSSKGSGGLGTMNAFDAFSEIASNPSLYSQTLADQQIEKRANTLQGQISAPQKEALKRDLGEMQTESQSYLDRVLAKRGLTSSGAVGAGLTDIAGKYAKAYAGGASNIDINAGNQARGRAYDAYDRQVAQSYADKVNQQLMGAVGQYQQSQQPTFWDYAQSVVRLIPGIGQGIDLLTGKKKSPVNQGVVGIS